MKAGYEGTFVISWSQTEADGLSSPPASALTVGSIWVWRGEALRVDGPNSVLRLGEAASREEARQGAARMVRKLLGAALGEEPAGLVPEATAAALTGDQSFVVTDGAESYTVTVVTSGSGARLLMFAGTMPPRGRDLWVVHTRLDLHRGDLPMPEQSGMICFTPGTWIETEDGPVPVEFLREGDKVLTADNGPQEILWKGARRMSGARLHALPDLRPVRFAPGALGYGAPDDELIVSPEHRMLVTGALAQSLFNTPEVLVEAKHLIDGEKVFRDVTLPEVTYIHLLLPAHAVLWANGVRCESFHPASTALSALEERDRMRLISGMPQVVDAPQAYGPFARRVLLASEAAILRYEAA